MAPAVLIGCMHRLPIGRLLLMLVAILVAWVWWSHRAVHHAPGVLVADAPVQVAVPSGVIGEREGFELKAVAQYALRGRVLGTKRYYGGVQAPLVPIDVAVGWGKMSDQAIVDQLTLTMGNRVFFYEWRNQPPIPKDEIMRSAANNHVIAANAHIASAVRDLHIGQIVEMRGWLVDASGRGGFRWATSRQRDDNGNGACELFLVEELQAWNEPPKAPMQLASRK
jgi:hypothetical protein